MGEMKGCRSILLIMGTAGELQLTYVPALVPGALKQYWLRASSGDVLVCRIGEARLEQEL